eukprot:7366294-Prorocentrum_lima.AAC.1
MTSSLVGSEMCIRDSPITLKKGSSIPHLKPRKQLSFTRKGHDRGSGFHPVSYTHLTLPTICSV